MGSGQALAAIVRQFQVLPGRLNLFAAPTHPSMGEGAFGQVLPLPSGQKQVDQRDQRSTHPGGDQDVVGSEVALRIKIDHGFIRSLGHIGRLRPGAESLCEAGHTGCFFFGTGCRERVFDS